MQARGQHRRPVLAETIAAASVQDRELAAEAAVPCHCLGPRTKWLQSKVAYDGTCAAPIDNRDIGVEVVRHLGAQSTGTWQNA